MKPFVALLGLAAALTAQTSLIPAGSVWKYLDNGTDQGTAWRTPAFADSTWAQGPAELGYGDGGEATVVSFGPNSSAKYITTYFRKSFTVADASIFTGLTLRYRRDDGIVVYLNGVEVNRDNMPATAVGFTTPATAAAADDGNTWFSVSLPTTGLVTGTNVLAVEIHQNAGTSSDLSFDLELLGNTSVSLIRTPYLQVGTPSSIVVRWRTNVATDSRVRFGLSSASLTSTVDDAVATTEHAVTLTGLSPDTIYYYSVGSTTSTLAGADANHFFKTPPPVGGKRPTRIWVLGDPGTGDANQASVRDAYYSFTGATHTDLWLMLGDNVYETGTDAEFTAKLFNVYPTMLRKSVLWTAVGNHDTAGSSTPSPTIPYFTSFTFPTAGQAGGVASGSKAYYSFDFGNIHFVVLDSMTSSRTAGSPMLTWLANDLAANTKDWLIAIWHHPPYSKGSHDSDTDTIMTQMRQNVLPILENNGVDLVLTGHSHSYERSYFIDGHYGLSSTFTAAMKKDPGSGNPAYTKALIGPSSHAGAVYAVAGSSGKISGGLLNHPAMFISLNQLGSMVLDINNGQMDVKFLNNAGAVTDSFSMTKGATPNTPPTVTLTSPANGAAFTAPATVNIAANANDTDGTVQRVDFYQGATLLFSDTTAPYSYSWTNVPAGSYSITARAFDNLGASTTSTAAGITVAAGNAPPTVSLTSPANNAIYTAPATVSIAANAADADGTIQRVEFYQGATLLGTDTTAPYSFSWTSVAAGTYSITARAFDNLGAATNSTAVSITVNQAATTLIAKNSVWKYLDNGSNQGTAWRDTAFVDTAWASGAGQLGYGDGGEATVVGYGPSSNNKYITTYFRKTINVTNPAFTTLRINIVRDDGAVIYVNGTEVARTNMPAGAVSYTTRASSAINGAAESTYNVINVPASALLAGANVIAVEIHQNAPNSSDISFDLELIGQ